MLYQTHNSIGSKYFQCVVYTDFYYSLHMHKFPEILYVLEGEVDIYVNGHHETAKQGDFAIVLGNLPHAYSTPHHSRVWVTVFSEDFVAGFDRMHRQYSNNAVFPCNPETRRFLLARMVAQGEGERSLLETKACLYAACAEYEKVAVWQERTVKPDKLLEKVLLYIGANFKENITLAGMAAALNYEPHYLSRRFNELLGCGFREFLNRYRVDAAKEILARGQMDISQTAFECGFQSIRNFNRAFLQYAGTTPSAFMST